MRKGFLVSLVALCAGSGIALAQSSGAPVAVLPADAPAKVEKKDALSFSCPAAIPSDCNACCAERCPCGPPGRFWISAEYLYWWTKDMRVPPLVTVGAAADSIPGALGQPGTHILLGGGTDSEGESGGRFEVGFWLNEAQTIGIEADYLFLGGKSNTFVAGASGAPGSAVIARPFLDIPGSGGAPFQNAELVAFPGAAAGTISVHTTSQLQGAGVNGLFNLCCCDNCCSGYRIDVLGGFRWMQLSENLDITENINPTVGLGAAFPAGSNVVVMDEFSTRNDFYGGQIGLRGEWRRDKFFVNGRALVALGDTHEHVSINGDTTITLPGGAPHTSVGGLLAQSSNIGSYSRDEFSVIPEIGFNVGYQVTPHVRAYVGYTFLYWSNVVRPGDAIDLGVNPTQLPNAAGPGTLIGPARPAFEFHDSSFWAQGLNVGFEFRF